MKKGGLTGLLIRREGWDLMEATSGCVEYEVKRSWLGRQEEEAEEEEEGGLRSSMVQNPKAS